VGVVTGLYMYHVVVKSSHSLSHLLMSFLFNILTVTNTDQHYDRTQNIYDCMQPACDRNAAYNKIVMIVCSCMQAALRS